VSFLILAIGSLAEFRNTPGYEVLVWIAVVTSLALSMLSLLFSRRAAAQATSIASVLQSTDGGLALNSDKPDACRQFRMNSIRRGPERPDLGTQ
jgi:hypothetical protein